MSETRESLRSCATCLLCLREDYGYSNYTCEGTTFACLAGLNPALDGMEDDSWDGTLKPALAAALDVALTCPRYRFGAPATLDVDQEGIPSEYYGKPVPPAVVIAGGYTDDPEAAALLALRLSGGSPS